MSSNPTMNKHRYLLLAAALSAGSLFAANKKDDAAANVTVSFQKPDEFTDARSSFGFGTDEGYLATLSNHLKSVAGKALSAGQKLEVTITDVDLAGEFLPTRRTADQIRVVKEIYIPRIALTFKITDASGKVVKEGERRLSDLNFMSNLNVMDRGDPLFYDKALLTDWVRKELK